MTKTDTAVDTKYLFKRNETWWVKVAVPQALRENLGYDLRKSLHTHDLEQAQEARWAVAEEFRARIEKAHKETDSKSANQESNMVDIEVASPEKAAGAKQVDEYIVEIVSDSGEGAQKCGQILGLVSGKMGNGVWTVEIIPAEIQPPARERQGASGIRVRMGSKEMTNMGDEAEMVVAFNDLNIRVCYSVPEIRAVFQTDNHMTVPVFR